MSEQTGNDLPAASTDLPTNAQAFWITGPSQGEWRGLSLPELQPGQVQVRTLHTGISRGTETLVFKGKVPLDEYQRMRAPFQQGDFPAPVKYGYMSVGEVVAGPPGLKGRTVFCLYPHQTAYVVDADAVQTLPAQLPARRAVLAANMETAINGTWDGRPMVGDAITVIGAGVVGCLVAWLCQQVAGTRVQLVDINAAREATARELGIPFALPEDAAGDQDLVFHASASEAGLQHALSVAGLQARVVEMSWYGDQPVTLPLGGAFHSRRLKIVSSQVGRVPPGQQPRWTLRRRMHLALQLLCDPALDSLISGHSRYTELPAIMAQMAGGDAGFADALCHRIDYSN